MWKSFQEEAQAFAGLVQAMYDTNTVAIVRRCHSERSAPEIGFLRPHISHDHIVGCELIFEMKANSVSFVIVYVLCEITIC